MQQWFKQFTREETAQDLIEYTLLLSFIAIAAAALFLGTGSNVHLIWSATNNTLQNATSQVGPGGLN